MEDIDTQLQMQQDQMAFAQGDSTDEQFFIQQQREREDLIKWQQNLGDEIDELKNRLRGYSWDGEKWVSVEKPLMNEEGVRMVEVLAKPLLSKNLINSNLSEKMILKMLQKTCDDLVDNIAEYGINKYSMKYQNFSVVVRIFKNVVIPTPFRAMNGWNKKQDNLIQKRVEAFNESPIGKQEKKSFWNMIGG